MVYAVDYSFQEDLCLLIDAAEEAGKIAMRYFRKNPQVWIKEGNSPVSEADYAVDHYLKERLISERPEYGWLSEETNSIPFSLSSRRIFVVDPLDGTRGFLKGEERWCISIAVVEEGKTLTAVLKCPALGETYASYISGGATLNGAPIHVRRSKHPFDIAASQTAFDDLPSFLRKRLCRVRSIPSLAYRLALIACGSLDATLIKPDAKDWDLAAADLIIHEAGGFILDASGCRPHYGINSDLSHGSLLAARKPILDEMPLFLKSLSSSAG